MMEDMNLVARIALIVGAGGPSLSAAIQLASVPKVRARRTALAGGFAAAIAASWGLGTEVGPQMMLDVCLGGPLVGVAAMKTYDGARAVKTKMGQ